MNDHKHHIFFLLMLFSRVANGQPRDTVWVGRSDLQVTMLRPGVHQYLVYLRNGQDSSRTNFQIWSRHIDHMQYNNRPAIKVTQSWENSSGIFHTAYSICDAKDFSPLYHDYYRRQKGRYIFDFVKQTMVTDSAQRVTMEADQRQKMESGFYAALDEDVVNWHLDLELFSLLKYDTGLTFAINFYDPGFDPPAWQFFHVTGSAFLKDRLGKNIHCWVVHHDASWGAETFWISKNTRDVLKVVQQFGDRIRYKIRLVIAAD